MTSDDRDVGLRELHGEWAEPSEGERRGLARWCRYYADTEDYDAGLPHEACADGTLLPLPPYRAASSKYADRKLVALGLTRGVPGRRPAARMSYAELRLHAATDEQLKEWR